MRAFLKPHRPKADTDKLAEDARVLGMANADLPEAPAEPVLEIHEDCLPAYNLYQAALTQARFTPMGGFAGFDYPGVEAAARLAGIEITPDLFADLRLMEAETTAELRRQAAKNKDRGHGQGGGRG